jgi:hypothetical protein
MALFPILRKPVVLAAACVLVVAGAAYAVGAGRLGSGVIHGCVVKSGGDLRVVKPDSKCRVGEKRITWNVAGKRGPAGARGPAGQSAFIPGPPPSEVASKAVNAGPTATKLHSISVTTDDDQPHRLLFAGSITAVCNPCLADDVTVRYSLQRVGAAASFSLSLGDVTGNPSVSGVVSEIIVTPAGCAPCVYELWVSATDQPPLDGVASVVDLVGSRLGYVDLGPVA